MHFLTTFLLSSISLSALGVEAVADGTSRAKHRKHAALNLESRAIKNSTYKLTDMYKGKTFLDGWEFFSGGDPTHGNVDFVTAKQASSSGLAGVQKDGTVLLAVDSTSKVAVGGKRKSVRINTKKTYNGGLFLVDVKAMPFGCGVWPAWWSVGPNWPAGGEIDVIEGVNKQATNQYTLHTSPGCTLTPPKVSGNIKAPTGKALNRECASGNGHNLGCAFVDTDHRSYGQGFNAAGGGVYAHTWDSTGIKMWHFSRSEVPADITSGKPNPSTWPSPAASFSSSSCDMAKHFHDHVLTFDTTICGDWAGSTYSSSGCPGTCAQAVANPANFKNAKWVINYVAVYQQ